MTEDEKTEPTEETGAATDKAADSTDAQTQTEAKADAEAPEIETPETGAPETETATEQKDEQEAEAAPSVEDRLAETNDQLLRALAELENTRRRADRDRAEALKYGAASFARDMLGVADNLQRALNAVAELDQDTSARCRKIPARRCCRDRTRPDCKHGPPQGQRRVTHG